MQNAFSLQISAPKGRLALELIKYELKEPAHSPEDCRRLGLTYGRDLSVRLRLHASPALEGDVSLGILPGLVDGSFIIDGVDRILVAQLTRSPGAEFFRKGQGSSCYGCRIYPERGCPIRLTITRGDKVRASLGNGKEVPARALLTAMGLQDTVRDEVKDDPLLRWLVQEKAIDPDEAVRIVARSLKGREAARAGKGEHEELERARHLFQAPEPYSLGTAARQHINRRLHAGSAPPGGCPADTEMALLPIDVLAAIRHLLELRADRAQLEDRVGERRVRAVGDLLADSLQRAFAGLRRHLETKRLKDVGPDCLEKLFVQGRARQVSGMIYNLFTRSGLSQVADQTNPLALLTHQRRLTLMGPGGPSRTQAQAMLRDLDASQYGRICPVETPEGANMGLLSTVALDARIDREGLLTAPYRPVTQGRVSASDKDIVWLRAVEEADHWVAPADTPLDKDGRIRAERVLARHHDRFLEVDRSRVEYLDARPRQLVGLSAGLIPFLEHDDAIRALMGSNMQRQAVPLLRPEPPLVATGLERAAAQDSGMAVRAKKAGTVTAVDSRRIQVGEEKYQLRKFVGLNGGGCLNQRPVVKEGQQVEPGQVLADGPAMCNGQLALGQNVLVAFMSWEGYGFEDGIVVSERLVQEDLFTSLHIKELVAETRRTRSSTETAWEIFTRFPPDFYPADLEHLDDRGIVKVGSFVRPGMVLVGKVTPLEKTVISPEEKLAGAIFAQLARKNKRKFPREVKNDSLQAPDGMTGFVVGVQHLRNEVTLSKEERDLLGKGRVLNGAEVVSCLSADVEQRVTIYVASKRPLRVGDKMSGRHGNKGVVTRILPIEDMPYLADGTPIDVLLNPLGVPSRMNLGQVLETHLGWAARRRGYQAVTPVFDGASEEDVRRCLKDAQLPQAGAVYLYDGRTGTRFEQPVTVGVTYLLKLRHLVEDKVHARSTGPYSFVSQQPVSGKARAGGQRFGEMEVWALEAHGAAHTLQELMTVKADDVEGRMRLYEALLDGADQVDAGRPASFEVLRSELRGLGLDLREIQNTEPIPDPPADKAGEPEAVVPPHPKEDR